MNISTLARIVFVVLLVFVAAHGFHLRAQTQPPPAAPPPSCATRPENRQFDFWVGEWDVKNPQGQLAGTNSVQLILGDCVVFENWTGTRGANGKSFNIYNAVTRKWQQTWVDNGGNVLELAGDYRDNQMRLTGETLAPGGAKMLHRLTYTKITADHIRQLWEQSADGGKTWTNAFDGAYFRRK